MTIYSCSSEKRCFLQLRRLLPAVAAFRLLTSTGVCEDCCSPVATVRLGGFLMKKHMYKVFLKIFLKIFLKYFVYIYFKTLYVRVRGWKRAQRAPHAAYCVPGRVGSGVGVFGSHAWEPRLRATRLGSAPAIGRRWSLTLQLLSTHVGLLVLTD